MADYSMARITDERKSNNARDVFISYLEAELNNLKRTASPMSIIGRANLYILDVAIVP